MWQVLSCQTLYHSLRMMLSVCHVSWRFTSPDFLCNRSLHLQTEYINVRIVVQAYLPYTLFEHLYVVHGEAKVAASMISSASLVWVRQLHLCPICDLAESLRKFIILILTPLWSSSTSELKLRFQGASLFHHFALHSCMYCFVHYSIPQSSNSLQCRMWLTLQYTHPLSQYWRQRKLLPWLWFCITWLMQKEFKSCNNLFAESSGPCGRKTSCGDWH